MSEEKTTRIRQTARLAFVRMRGEIVWFGGCFWHRLLSAQRSRALEARKSINLHPYMHISDKKVDLQFWVPLDGLDKHKRTFS